ncbi:hypothetical protein [Nocardia sp. NPDC019395]|uniref:hypothetical protein n=1 Tax=Nocardia sp. NPDC019395 TaxID=3154686 RepID=UPI0033DC6E8C
MRRVVSTETKRELSPARRLVALLGCLAVAAVVAACGSDTQPRTVSTSVTPAAAAGAPGGEVSITIPGTLAADFAELERSEKGPLGLAIMPVGGERSVGLGKLTTGPAWSTMKVPLVVAAERKNPGGQSYATSAAITASDNSAADSLWSGLGSPREAALSVQAVLREGGDNATVVQEKRSRSEYSSFGQSDWSLADQVRFASKLPCLPGSERAVELMGSVSANQQWGLGSVFGTAQFKGGWGPNPDGAYLVRQFGLVPVAGGTIAVAIAAQPDSGTFADGMDLLDKMAGLISRHLGEFTGGSCPA